MITYLANISLCFEWLLFNTISCTYLAPVGEQDRSSSDVKNGERVTAPGKFVTSILRPDSFRVELNALDRCLLNTANLILNKKLEHTTNDIKIKFITWVQELQESQINGDRQTIISKLRTNTCFSLVGSEGSG